MAANDPHTTIRPITCEVGLLPRAHGSGLFTRGETQVLTIATLGMPSESQTIDSLSPEDEKRYMHHYNFPPYSVGEARPMRGPGRRGAGGRAARRLRRWPAANLDSCCARRSSGHSGREKGKGLI